MKLSFKKDKFNFLLPRILEFIAGLKEDKEYELSIKQIQKTRSLNANNYSWTLTDRLSDVMVIRGVKLSKEEMHAEMIFRYGQVMLDENGERVIYSTKQGAKMNEFFPYAKEIGQSELNGDLFTHWLIYRGSRSYDSKEFSIFLSGIIEECKEQGIPTETPEEISKMISLMEESKNVHL